MTDRNEIAAQEPGQGRWELKWPVVGLLLFGMIMLPGMFYLLASMAVSLF